MPRALIGLRMQWMGETPSMLSVRYRKFADEIDDMSELWERVIKEAIQPMITRHFLDSGVDGQRYKPLARTTMIQKASLGYPTIPLIRSKRWMRNASSRVVWAVTKHDCRLVPARLRPTGLIQETGAPKKNLRARPVFVWDKQFYSDYAKIVNEWFGEQINHG